ncbi:hypothetical protein D3C86_2034340 [compost metagenome]
MTLLSAKVYKESFGFKTMLSSFNASVFIEVESVLGILLKLSFLHETKSKLLNIIVEMYVAL